MRRANHRLRLNIDRPTLAPHERRAVGAYYTPPDIVRLIVELTLGPLLAAYSSAPRILDPSCGAGEFTIEILRRMQARYGHKASRDAITAVDIDSEAIERTRRRLTELDTEFQTSNAMIADTLTTPLLRAESFDAVIGNPPFVNIRQLSKTASAARLARLRTNYITAHGNFDLYVLFIERALNLLKPGGSCGLIIPNKWATLDYARPCRELLLEHSAIEHVIDLSETRAFADAHVFPHIVVLIKRPAAHDHDVEFRPDVSARPCPIRQSSLNSDAFQFTPLLDVESRVATCPLGTVARLSCGTPGYSAAKIARHLQEAENILVNRSTADFITTGNIDRYRVRVGNVRYLNRTFVRPHLPLDCPDLAPERQRLFAAPKILIAGMSRRLEAAWDDRGLALGVQVYAASECQTDPFFLLALLNSKLLSFLFATRFAAKRLRGGYLAINKGQLARLPICFPGSDDCSQSCAARLARLAAEQCAPCRQLTPDPELDAQIDRLVYDLYRLSSDEVARVEAHFAALPARAA
jgi:tRNA1(Val) A37 N6-methylase TrmN6